MRDIRVRELWQKQQCAFNGWLAIPNSLSAEAMAMSGWDALTIDMQHGLIDNAALVTMLQALAASPCTPMVRVPWLDPGPIMRALDAGALGIICPMINSVDEAARLVEYTSYAPMGGRSFGPIRAGLVDGPHYQASANQRVIRFAMIETRKALDQLDAILQVEGLDAIYVGPSDLSLSLGCKPTLDDVEPTVQQAIEHILERAHAHGLKAGIHSQTVNFAKARKALGYDLVTTASDLRLILAGAQDLMKAWRAP